jgi:hypothetical protein
MHLLLPGYELLQRGRREAPNLFRDLKYPNDITGIDLAQLDISRGIRYKVPVNGSSYIDFHGTLRKKVAAQAGAR